ncbi:MAG: FAD-binding oxidoreductase [SAR202 cluster bacterium]|nr:FAD-binding oxidoreductase [SAR202 cluster bacterium]
MKRVADIAVIGAGCMGLSIAWHLARAGAGRVIVIDQRGVATGATANSSAILRTHYENPALASMAWHGLKVFSDFEAIAGGPSGFRKTGFLFLGGKKDAAAIRKTSRAIRALGINSVILEAGEFHHIEARTSRDDIGVVIWEPESGHASASVASATLADAARRSGAQISTGETVISITGRKGRVTGIESTAGKLAVGTVVVAAGFRSMGLLEPLGVKLPLTPVRHPIAVVTTAGSHPVAPVVGDRILGAYHRPEGSNQFLVGRYGFMDGDRDESVEEAKPARATALESLLKAFKARWPYEANARLARSYTGVYDCTPDLEPALGPVAGVDGLHVAAGFSGHGFKLSPAVGEMVAGGITGDSSRIARADRFDVRRFELRSLK